MRILVLGANGRLGKVIAERLADDGHDVRGLVRRVPGQGASVPRIEYVEGDALEEPSLHMALAGQDIVMNAIGSGTLRRNTVETDTTRAVLQALSHGTTRRYIAMSSGMVAPVSFVFDRIIKLLIFRNVYREHRTLEALVRASNLDWTIVRPSRLTDRPARGYIESATARPRGPISITRRDVADFISKVVAQDLYHCEAVFLVSR